MLERRWPMRVVGDTLRGIALACLVVLLVIAGSAVAAGPSAEYLALLEVAKAEGKATIGGFAFDPEEIATLEKGFKKRFGFPVKLTHDPTHIRDLPPKVIAGGFDVVEVNVAGGHQILASPRGLVQVEWSMFAHEFPQLDTIQRQRPAEEDRKSTRLNSSHGYISYA